MYLHPSLHICTLRKLYIHKLIDIINCLMKQEEAKWEKMKTRRLRRVYIAKRKQRNTKCNV